MKKGRNAPVVVFKRRGKGERNNGKSLFCAVYKNVHKQKRL